jgi:phage-related protein
MKKQVIFDKRAEKEFLRFPKSVRLEFVSRLDSLQRVGYLNIPFGKKLSGYSNLFEIIVKYRGQWRVLYTYMKEDFIVLLYSFRKKSQKTLQKDISIAIRRLKFYQKIDE